MKEAGTAHWSSPNIGATNSSGFNALPAGGPEIFGGFGGLNDAANFWSDSEVSTTIVFYSAWDRELNNNVAYVDRIPSYKQWFYSIRCLKD